MESGDSVPDERFLQSLWLHQRLRRDALRTLEGDPLRVLHPGFLNREAGPDFKRAVLQFGAEPACSGDVEIDLRVNGWREHGHDRNPDFRGVVLHVVWVPPAESVPMSMPTLALSGFLDAPLSELDNLPALETLPSSLRPGCCAKLVGRLKPDDWTELLQHTASLRLQGKAQGLKARARQAGWTQSLHEALMAGLGYKQNTWPMQVLAQRSAPMLQACPDPLTLQARLFGTAGLLPGDIIGYRPRTARYLRQLWDVWWRDHAAYDELRLPSALWRLGGLRPANQPHRRLALASQWLLKGHLPAALERWLTSPLADNRLLPSLRLLLQGDPDAFWSHHWSLQSRRLATPEPLLGPQRATDLAMNAVLPWLWARAQQGPDTRLRDVILHRYQVWPGAQDNAVLRLARQRLLCTPRTTFRRAYLQQGLLQVVRDFCDRSNALCDGCRFPSMLEELVR